MSDYRQRRKLYQDISGSSTLLATDDLSAAARTLVTGKANYSIFIQKLTVSVTTDNAATQTFRDSAGTPVKIATTKASPGLVPIVYDFGSNGVQLTEGQKFEQVNSAAGLAAKINWEGYLKPTAAARALSSL